MRKTLANSFFMAVLALATTQLQAQNQLFTHTDQSNILSKGALSTEFWYANKNGGTLYFNGNYGRTGFNVGLSKKLAFGYFYNFSTEAFVGNSISEIDQTTRYFDDIVTDKRESSFTTYVKFKALDKSSSKFGLALSTGLTVGSNYVMYEPKIIIDKNIGMDYLSFNASAAIYQMDNSQAELRTGTDKVAATKRSFLPPQYAFNLGYLHYLSEDKFAVGLEMRTQSESSAENGLSYIALFGGAAVHARYKNWTLNFSAMPQLKNLYKSWQSPDNLVLDKQQNFQLRAMIGFNF
jgi:hypothetical protein